MKINIRYCILLITAFGLFVAGCEKKEIIFEGSYHVRFTEPTGSSKESYNKPIQLSVHLAGPQLSEDVTVRYAVSGTAREGIDYEIEGTRGEVEIPAGESFGYITLNLINNANNILESQDIVFTILEVSPSNLKVGRSEDGIIGSKMTYTIIDDCILSGSYTGRSDFTKIAVPGIVITSTDCETYTLTNWNIDLLSISSVKLDLTFIDNGDNTLTIPPQVEDVLSLANDTIQGTGTINPVNGRLSFNINLVFQTGEDTDTSIIYPVYYIPEK